MKKLPDQKPPTPPGLESWILKRLPFAWLVGTAIPGLVVLFSKWRLGDDPTEEMLRQQQLIDFTAIGAVAAIWTLALIVAIGCVVVVLMKGPGYVADGFEVSHSDHPKPDDDKLQA